MGGFFRGVCSIALLFATATIVSAQPGAPANFQASVSGTTVSFTWTPVAGAAGYRIEAGSGPGLIDNATLDVPAASTYEVANVPPGTYHVRLRTLNANGVSLSSNEVIVVVGTSSADCSQPPPTPTRLRAVVDGTQVNLSWTPSGCAATHYFVRAGSSDGASDLAVLSVPTASLSANAPDGLYFVTVVAANAHGVSAPTPSLVVLVAAPTTGGRVGFNAATPTVSPDAAGNAVVIGEVVNRSVAAAVFIRVGAQLRDASGNVIGTYTTYLRGEPRRLSATGVTDDSALAPGKFGCFYIQTDLPIGSVQNATLQLTHDSFASVPMRSRVDAVDITRLSDPRFTKLAISIANGGPSTTQLNVATAYLKRGDGRAVGCDIAIGDEVMPPGHVSTTTVTTHAPSSSASVTSWITWLEAGDPLAALAAQTFYSMRNLVNSGQKREAHAAWEALQTQRRAAVAQ
jgi:hypothetical protein